MSARMMCPHCGAMVKVAGGLTGYHLSPGSRCGLCPGSKQVPRCAESDARPLWNGERNPHLFASSPEEGK